MMGHMFTTLKNGGNLNSEYFHPIIDKSRWTYKKI